MSDKICKECDKKFVKFHILDDFCSHSCCYNNLKKKEELSSDENSYCKELKYENSKSSNYIIYLLLTILGIVLLNDTLKKLGYNVEW